MKEATYNKVSTALALSFVALFLSLLVYGLLAIASNTSRVIQSVELLAYLLNHDVGYLFFLVVVFYVVVLFGLVFRLLYLFVPFSFLLFNAACSYYSTCFFLAGYQDSPRDLPLLWSYMHVVFLFAFINIPCVYSLSRQTPTRIVLARIYTLVMILLSAYFLARAQHPFFPELVSRLYLLVLIAGALYGIRILGHIVRLVTHETGAQKQEHT